MYTLIFDQLRLSPLGIAINVSIDPSGLKCGFMAFPISNFDVMFFGGSVDPNL